jgi:hypothetical protein
MSFVRKENLEMKTVVRLAMVVAALLVVSIGNVEAQCILPACDESLCYDITATAENMTGGEDTWFICLHDNGDGQFYSQDLSPTVVQMHLFGGGLGWPNFTGNPMFGGNPNWTMWIAHSSSRAGFLRTIGPGKDLIEAFGDQSGLRFIATGKKVALSNCCFVTAP